jgi:RES domain-containing protein
MELWRISNYSDLSGLGGMRASGRWQTRGKRIVYLADHPASALLEMLVRLDPDLIPATYTLLRVNVPDIIESVDIDVDALPSDWRLQPALTRQLGDEWLDRNETALLHVPSAIVPSAWNVLLNPAHANAAFGRVVEAVHSPFDLRLLRTS